MSEAPSPFFSGTTLQYAWDSTSLGYLMDCPRKYKYTILDGWRKKDESVHLTFGGNFAKAMEVFAHARAAGADHEEALDVTVAAVLELTWLNREVDEIGVEIPGTGEPWNPDNSPKKNRDTLLRTVIWYFEEYRDDPAKTMILPGGKAATEVTFKLESGIKSSHDGSEYLLTGHLDKGVNYGDDPFVMDQKTTGGGLGAYYFSQYDLSNQMSQYTFAGRIVWNVPLRGVIIDAAAILVGSTTFGRSITMRSEAQLEEWHSNVGQWLKLAERFAGDGVYPMNLQSCNNYGGCVFKSICSKDPRVREKFLETDFERRYWNPLEDR